MAPLDQELGRHTLERPSSRPEGLGDLHGLVEVGQLGDMAPGGVYRDQDVGGCEQVLGVRDKNRSRSGQRSIVISARVEPWT